MPGQEIIKLDEPDISGGQPLFKLLNQRRSLRSYANQALDLKTLAQLLWASQGVKMGQFGHGLRTAPSAGALYPIELYVAANNIIGLEPGIYRYEALEHGLKAIRLGSYGHQLTRAALGQEMLEEAPCAFSYVANPMKSQIKYGDRAYRYIYLEAGHIAQNTILAAESCGLGTCNIGAFYDGEMNDILNLGKAETIVYITVIGYKK
ncbi:MAG: SagB/ThcOx family dehydrogenase [Bacillota bacterium]